MWHDPKREPKYSEYIELDLGDVVASIAGPKRPQDRIALTDAKTAFRKDIHNYVEENLPAEHTKLDEAVEESLPGQRPRGAVVRRQRHPGALGGGELERQAEQSGGRQVRGPRRVHPRPRRGGDRGDHVVHQHLQSRGDDRRCAAGQERRREGPDVQAVGEDHDGAGFAGGHRLLRKGRAVAVSGEARLLSGRLRLHDLHRQLRPAAGRDQQGDQRLRPVGRRGALG